MKLKKWVKLVLLLLILTPFAIILLNNKDSKSINKNINKKELTTTTTNKIIENKNEVNITLVGDFLFESPFYKAVEKGYDKNNYFESVKDYFKNDDLSIGNMEVVIGNDSLNISGDGYNFCAPSYIGDLITNMDIEVLSTANNHTYDRNLEGINSTLDYLNNKNILTVGTNKSGTNELKILEINGIKIGFISYTLGTNQNIPDENKKYVNVYRNSNKEFSLEKQNEIKENIKNLKNESVDAIIAIMHWGQEFTFKENNEQTLVAEFLNKEGVDIILGSHSHSIQPIKEITNDNHTTLVYYSFGNFTSQDDDIARTPLGEETFDNAYQFGLISTLTLKKENNNVIINNVKTNIIVNYFDSNLTNFKLIPLDQYTEEYEKSHFRYEKGLTREFITNTYNSVIDSKYR